MRRAMARLVSATRVGRGATPARLDGDALRVRAQRSYQEAERAIDEWRAFVECRRGGLRAGTHRPGRPSRPPGGMAS